MSNRKHEETIDNPRSVEGRQPSASLQHHYGEHHLPPPGQRSHDGILASTNPDERTERITRNPEEGRQPSSASQHYTEELHHLQAGESSTPSTSTSQHYYAGPVSQYDLSNASNVTVSVGHNTIRGCLSTETITTRIQFLRDVFVDVHTVGKARQLLKAYGHVTISGAPGDGKTSIALILCEAYRMKNYQTLFVENIDEFDVENICSLKTNLLIVFDDIFGSVTFSCNLEKIRKIFSALIGVMLNTTTNRQNRESRRNARDSRDGGKPCQRLRVVFTSRTYNLNEGCSQLFVYKSSLFGPQTILNLTRDGLTSDEKTNIISSFLKWSKICDISTKDIKTITDLSEEMFGFPFICKLYFTTPAFQIHMVNFFRHPLNYLRGDLDLIVRECSSRSAAIILLVLSGGNLDLVSFQLKKETGTDQERTFLAVRDIIPSCTRTSIGKEINNFNGTYFTVERQTVSFSHPSVYDAAACAFGKLNIIMLLKHCTLRFMFERVRVNKSKTVSSTEPDDVTNMIRIDESLHPLVVSRLVEGVKQGYFNMTVNHPILGDEGISLKMLDELMDVLPTLIQGRDKDTNKRFLYWVSMTCSHVLFEKSLTFVSEILHNTSADSMMSSDVSVRFIDDLYDALVACVESGKLVFLQKLTVLLYQINKFNVEFITKEGKTLLMIASEKCHVDVFNFLLHKGAQVRRTGRERKTCLHLTVESGCEDITQAILDISPDLINITDQFLKTPAMICAKKGHMGLLQVLSSRGADLSLADEDNSDCLMFACEGGNMSIVKHLLSLKTFDINKKGGYFKQTPVMKAAEKGHYDVYSLLVSEGADLLLTNKYNGDCLMSACAGGNMSIVKHLLSLNTFDINRKGGIFKQTPVMVAAKEGHYDVYSLLVSEGADLSLTDEYNGDCLMSACNGGDMSIVKHLLSLKTFDINRKGGYCKQSPVMEAARRGYYDVYSLLVSEGADLSLTDKYNGDCLLWACEGGNVSIVKHLLSLKTFDINRKGGISKQIPVMGAAKGGHYDVYSLLVSEGADLSLTDEYNGDCLMSACNGGNMSIVKHLLSLKTFDINRKGGIFKQTPVMGAAEGGHYDVYSLLVSEGADLSLTDNYNGDCLMSACNGGNMSIVKHLLSLKTFDINRKGGIFKQIPVMVAAEGRHYGVYSLLVSEGADLSLTDECNNDCLMSACKGGNMSIVKHLLSLKTFDINRKGGYCKQSPVMEAARRGHYDVYSLLVSEGADLSLTDEYNGDCLMSACKGGNISIVKHLLPLKTFDINRKGGIFKQTPVMGAAEGGHYDVYSLLVSEGADLSPTDKYNGDCLMSACKGGNISIVKHLLPLKTFDINRKGGIFKQTPVMGAAEGGHYDVYSLLVSEGADLSLTDNYNGDCLMSACNGGNMSIVKHLLSLKTFDINRKGGIFKQTPVMGAAEGGHYDVYSLLVSEGADLSLTDEYNGDCLMSACNGGNMSIVKHLLSLKTFDINRIGGYFKQTPVMGAAGRGHYDVCSLLVSEGADLSLTDDYNSDCLDVRM